MEQFMFSLWPLLNGIVLEPTEYQVHETIALLKGMICVILKRLNA